MFTPSFRIDYPQAASMSGTLGDLQVRLQSTTKFADAMVKASSSEFPTIRLVGEPVRFLSTSRLRVTLRLVGGSCGGWMTLALGIHRDRQDRAG